MKKVESVVESEKGGGGTVKVSDLSCIAQVSIINSLPTIVTLRRADHFTASS